MPTLMVEGSPTKYHAGYTTNVSVDEILSGVYEALDTKVLDNSSCVSPLAAAVMSVIKHKLVNNVDKWTYLREGNYWTGNVDILVEYAVSYRRCGVVKFYFSGGMRSLAESPHNGGDISTSKFFDLMGNSALGQLPFNIYVEYNYNGSSRLYTSRVYSLFKDSLYNNYALCPLSDVSNHLQDKSIMWRDVNRFYNCSDLAISPSVTCLINTKNPFVEYLMLNSNKKDKRFEVHRVENEVLTSCKSGDKFTDDELELLEMAGLKKGLWVDSVFGDSLYGVDIHPIMKYNSLPI